MEDLKKYYCCLHIVFPLPLSLRDVRKLGPSSAISIPSLSVFLRFPKICQMQVYILLAFLPQEMPTYCLIKVIPPIQSSILNLFLISKNVLSFIHTTFIQHLIQSFYSLLHLKFYKNDIKMS